MRRTRPERISALVATLLAALLTLITTPATPADAVTGSVPTDSTFAATARLAIGEGDTTRACSGVLVDAQLVLTAASCFADDPAVSLSVPAGAPALKTTATIGRTDLTSTIGQVRNVAELFPAPDPSQDVILARLDGPVTGITPVALSATAPTAQEELLVAGYGRTTDEWAPLKLHTGTFSLDSVSTNEVGITGKDGVAVCKGDTGGPLLRAVDGSVELVGINSRSWQGGCLGTDATETRTSAVATRTDGLGNWIKSHVGIFPGQFYSARGFARTSTGADAKAMSIGPGFTVKLKVAGVGGVPASDVASVALNLTAKGTPPASGVAQGSLIAYSSDDSQAPAVTSARYRSDVRYSDLTQVKVGVDGNIKILNAGPVTATVDATVQGYTLKQASKATGPGSTYVGVTPSRIVNPAPTTVNLPRNGGTLTFSPLGLGNIPTSGVSQVEIMLEVSGSGDTPITAYPSGTTKPSDANVFASSPDFKDNVAIIPLGADNKVTIHNGGTADATVWVDVWGYFASPQAEEPGSLMVPVKPTRIVPETQSIGVGGTLTVAPLGRAGVPLNNVTSVGMTVTANSTNSTATGWLTVSPSLVASPLTRTTGYSKGIESAGYIDAKLGPDGKVIIKNNGNSAVNVAVDVYAYFKPVPPHA